MPPEVEEEGSSTSAVDDVIRNALRAEEDDVDADDERPSIDTGLITGQSEPEPEPEPEPQPEKPKRKPGRVPKAERAAAERGPLTMEEMEARDLVPRDLPDVVEDVKTLGDLMAKYNIGQDQEFKAQVSRSWPKVYPGGIKADGIYDTWDQPLTHELLQSEYGGGIYRIAIMGPNPKSPTTPKHYDGITVQYPGEPKYDRMPKAMQGRQGRDADYGAMPPPMAPAAGEHPKITEVVLGAMTDIVKGERDERRRMEDRAEKEASSGQAGVQPVVEAERRRADELIAAEKRLSQTEREHLAQQLSAERERFAALERKIEEMRMDVQGRPSPAEELSKLLAMPQLSGGGDKAAASSERMLETVLQKHGEELKRMAEQYAAAMDAVNRQNQSAMESARAAHQAELASMREAGRREIEAERDAARRQLESEKESGKRREERAEDQLKTERDERRRDQDRFREQSAERDQQWKDRMDNQKQMIEQSWESRHSSTVANYESSKLNLESEIARLKEDLRDAKTRVSEQNDPLAQITRAKELREAIVGLEPGAGGAGVGGITPPSDPDWKTTLVQEMGDKIPEILDTLGNIVTGKGGQQQQQQQGQPPLVPGQLVQTPQGEMVVVNTPQGLRLTPRALYEQHMAAQQQQGGSGVPRPRAMAPMTGGGSRRKRKDSRGRSVVPNLASAKYGDEPLIKQKSPYEDDDDDDERPQEAAPRQRRQVAAPQAQPQPQQQLPQQPQQQVELSEKEKAGLGMLAKLVHDSVMTADEPEEFVQKVLGKYPPEVIKQVVGSYTPDQIAYGIAQLAPTSAGATPGGQQFVRQAFAALVRALEATT